MNPPELDFSNSHLLIEDQLDRTIEPALDVWSDAESSRSDEEEWGERPYLEKVFKQITPEVEHDHNITTAFFKELAKNRLLTPIEQKAHALRYQKYGDIEARNRLIAHNLRLVVVIAKNYRFRWHDFDYLDLIQEGVFGLFKAAIKYDYKNKSGANFTTYAVWWIKQMIASSIRDKGRMIRIPAHISELQTKIFKASMELLDETGREPTAQQIAERLEMPVGKIKRTLSVMKMNVIRLDDFVTQDSNGNGRSYFDLTPDKKLDPCHMLLITQELEESLKSIHGMLGLIKGLSDRNKMIFNTRYGLKGSFEIMTLEEVGQKFDMTRERVRQIVAKVWTKLSRVNGYSEAWLENEVLKNEEIMKYIGYEAAKPILDQYCPFFL